MRFEEVESDYVREQISRLCGMANYQIPVSELQEKTGGLVLGWKAAGLFVAANAMVNLTQREPYSMVRLGDGEGNILAMVDPDVDPDRQLRWANAVVRSQAGNTFDTATAREFAAGMERAMLATDVLGVRMLTPWHDDLWLHEKTRDWAEWCLETKQIRGALGVVRAHDQVLRWLGEDRLKSAVLTHAWIYGSLLDHLRLLVQAADLVLLITCRTELLEGFRRAHPGRGFELLEVPPEPNLRSTCEPMRPHYPEAYHDILGRLQGNLAGCLVLVGAGVFGKLYCDAARCGGGVALDLGSGFDILAGIKSRGIHDEKWIAKHRMA